MRSAATTLKIASQAAAAATTTTTTGSAATTRTTMMRATVVAMTSLLANIARQSRATAKRNQARATLTSTTKKITILILVKYRTKKKRRMVDVVQRSKPHKRDVFQPEKPSHSMKHVTRSLLQDELDADECLTELEKEFGDHDVTDDTMNPFAFDN
jgi:hypothetical protein